MGDDFYDQQMVSEYLFTLVNKKMASGMSGEKAYQEATQELARILHGPGNGEKVAQELRDKLEDLVSKGKSRSEAFLQVQREHLKELQKPDSERLKEFLDSLRDQRAKEREDKSLDDAKDIVIESFGKEAGVKLLKDLWGSLWSDKPLGRSFFGLIRDTLHHGSEELAKSGRDGLFKQTQDWSFPELVAQTEKTVGPNSPHLTLQELFLTTAAQKLDTNIFDHLKLGRDADRALEKLGMMDVRGQNVFQAGKQDIPLDPVASQRQGFDSNIDAKVNVNFRLDTLAKEGPVPDVLGKIELGAKLRASYTIDHTTFRAELQPGGELDLKDAKKWQRVFGEDYLKRHGKAEVLFKLGADIRPDTTMQLSIDADVQTHLDRSEIRWSWGGSVNLRYSWDGDEQRQRQREKLYEDK